MRWVGSGTLLACLWRAVQKSLFVDTETGLYQNGGGFPFLFFLLLAALLGGLAWQFRRPKVEPVVAFKGNRAVEVLSIAVAPVVGLHGIFTLRFAAIVSQDELLNRLGKPFLLAEGLLGIASACFFCYLAFLCFSGARRSSRQGLLAFLPVLWLLLVLLDRFLSFQQVATASDQWMETFFWVAAVLFFLAQVRLLADIGAQPRRVVGFGLAMVVLGLPLTVGQGVSLLLLGELQHGPNPLLTLLIALLTAYGWAVSQTLLHTAKQEKAAR